MKAKATQPKSMDEVNNAECHFEVMDSSALNKATFPREWLINRILVLNQPGVIGGPKKTLKTSLMVDMAISISSGKPFLGYFQVPRRRSVAVFSGESDRATLQDIARRVCKAKNVCLKVIALFTGASSCPN